jgi:hypothetical protein
MGRGGEGYCISEVGRGEARLSKTSEEGREANINAPDQAVARGRNAILLRRVAHHHARRPDGP